MPSFQAIRQFARDFFAALGNETRLFFAMKRPMVVREDTRQRFVALTGKGLIEVDAALGTIRLKGRLAAPIKAVQSVQIEYVQSGDGPEIWKIVLCLLRQRRVEVARLFDDIEASQVGARLGTLTGCPVELAAPPSRW